MQREFFEQKRMKLADIVACGEYEGYFTLRPGEQQAAFLKRLTGADSEPGKVLRYRAAMRAGAKFPPVLVTLRGSEHTLQEGRHRCSAAALLGRTTISAVVFNVETDAEEELVSRLSFELSEVGVPWQAAVRFIGDALATGSSMVTA